MTTSKNSHHLLTALVVLLSLGLHSCKGDVSPDNDTSNTRDPDTTAPVITLTGSTPVDLIVGQTYTEQGAICSDNVDASKAATVGGPAVVTTAPAVFIVTYNCTDAAGNSATQVTRTVNVTATDITAPVITLTGATTITLYIGQTYTEQGAICSDNVDASKAATVGGPVVVTTAAATFILTYNCTDAAGNPAIQVTRTVNILAYGLTQRPSNTDCSIPESPTSSSSFALTRVFPNLSFNSPVALRQSPVNADRWYVVEQGGVIRTFLSTDTSSTVFADLTNRVISGGERGLLGMAFHPNFASNNYVYVYYSGNDNDSATDHSSYISRFTATSATTLNTSSEFNIITIGQPYSNHNGGNILFGADGYLYIGMGDGGSGGDPQNYAQNINSLLGKMLRIDVNNTSTGKNYAIPADNPYAGATAGADEIYALGLRNPWRWSFERGTNNLIAGDVGQDNWEEVDIITSGGNYGWRCYEGNHSYNTSGCAAQSAYTAPIHEYDHNTGYSITGGYVYHGSIQSLAGNYIFTDYGPGPIWAISDPFGTPVVRELINDSTTNAISKSSFAEDAAGEIYVLRHSSSSGYIYKITATVSTPNNNFPNLLSETGCVNVSDATQMYDGLIPYDINAPFWSDGAAKDRWFAIPDGAHITVEQNGDWTFPNNSVLVKNFRINNKLVETRLLVKHSNGGWGGYSYEWNDAETDATFLSTGKTKLINGQNYIYPSSAQCMQCHTGAAGIALGPKTRQMNRTHTYATTGINANQIDTLNHIGMFSSSLASAPSLPTLTVPTNTSASLHDRARAYLYTNCSQCHRPGGGTNVDIDFNITTADADMRICNVASTYPGSVNTRLVPGNASASSIYRRMSCREGVGSCTVQDQMPPIGTTVVDANGAVLIEQWINSLTACPL